MKRFVYLFTLALLSLSTNVMAQSGTTQPPLQPEGKPMYQTGKKIQKNTIHACIRVSEWKDTDV